MRRTRLRSRVLLLTAAFSFALFAIAFGMSWRAKLAEERWSRLVGVESEAIARLEELIRAQNAFHSRFVAGDPHAADRYRVVEQLLQDDAFAAIDLRALRGDMAAFRDSLNDDDSRNVVAEAQRIIDERKREIAAQLPELRRDSHDTMFSGLAVVWIVVISSFAAVQITLRKVVRPLEDLAAAADRITAGDLSARAPVAGDAEIARLGTAVNRMADELKARARTDELTGLPNFRAFREQIDAEIERAARYEAPFGVLVLDLDRFKKYNDTYGHLAGNDALRRVSRVLRETVRAVDFAARYGGEEFAVIVPQIDIPALTAIAERVREGVEALPAPPDGAQLTISIGAALYPLDGKTVDALFVVADERLYLAKKRGRNVVVASSGPAVAATAAR